jgi:hypothetical protein
MDYSRRYSFYSPDLYEPNAENVGCGVMSWGRDWVQTFYPAPSLNMSLNPRYAQIRSTVVQGPQGRRLRPQGWLFSPLEIQNWKWPE